MTVASFTPSGALGLVPDARGLDLLCTQPPECATVLTGSSPPPASVHFFSFPQPHNLSHVRLEPSAKAKNTTLGKAFSMRILRFQKR